MKNTSSNQNAKKLAGEKAASFVQNGMFVGLGTGSTAAFAIKKLGQQVQNKELEIECVATSFQSAFLAKEAGLLLVALDSISKIDLSIDGADRVDINLNLIKGGGAAHTREKLVHAMSLRFIVVADESKKVQKLDASFPVPVEIIPEAISYVEKRLFELGAKSVVLRMAKQKDGPVITDNGLMVLDSTFEDFEPQVLEKEINLIPGVLENGIFSFVKPSKGDCLIGTEKGIEIL